MPAGAAAAAVCASQLSTSYGSWDPLHSKQLALYRKPWSAKPAGALNYKRFTVSACSSGIGTSKQGHGKKNWLSIVGGDKNTFIGKVSRNLDSLIRDMLKILQKPAVALVVIGLLMSSPNDALAAGGGRMGGRSFSSGSSRSSQTYSMPRSGRSMDAFSFTAPYAAPSPFFGGGFYVTPAYGVGFGGGGVVLMLLLGFMAFQLVSGFLVDREEGTLLSGTTKTSVMKLQVGLLGMARSLQRELEDLASRADTSNPEGLHYILTETVLSLMRHPDYCISGTSSSEVKKSVEAGESRFNQLSLEERGKFDEETLVSVDNIRKRSAPKSPSKFNNEYIVVTILVAAQGDYKLPGINSNADLKAALTKLGSVPAEQVLAVEVLWTPQDENDSLSEKELLRDYPLLRPL